MPTALYLAILLLAGFAGGKLANRIGLPSVTGYLIFGLILGPSVLNIITSQVYEQFSLISNFAVSMLTVSVGMELHRDVIKKDGKNLLPLSLINTILTFTLVTLVLWALGLALPYSLIIGVAALTISPSGVVGILKEEKAKGEMTNTLLKLVAFDNLICVILFGIVLSIVNQLQNAAVFSFTNVAISSLKEVFFALGIGLVTGLLFSFFVQREQAQEKLLVIFISMILLNLGLSVLVEVSPILASIFSGITIANSSTKPGVITQVYNRIELPIFILFLTLSGAHIDLSIISSIGLIGLAYLILRIVGRVGGIFIASRLTSLDNRVGKYLGFGMLPQAGIAIGLVTIAEQTLSASGIMSGVILTAVIFFEIFGPLLLRKAILTLGEHNRGNKRRKETVA